MASFLSRVCKALDDHNVQYALVGGYAVALQGVVRGTIDIDLVITASAESYESTAQAMKSLGLTPHLPLTASQIFTDREALIRDRHLVAWSFVALHNPLEVIDIIITYPLKPDMVDRLSPFGGSQEVCVLKKEHLIEMKRQSARPQDLADVEALSRLIQRDV